jgi:NitT/TauT family transport system substrate-binding protein
MKSGWSTLCGIAWLVVLSTTSLATAAEPKTHFDVAWSVYAGWAPWGYADSSGLLRKWADRYGIDIKLHLVSDYTSALRQYRAGKFDACAMTNIDALSSAASAGLESTAIIVGDFSNGNDGIVIKGGAGSLSDIRGQSVYLVEGSVSQYLLARALTSARLTERDVRIVDTPDSRIASAFAAAPAGAAAVTWQPQLSQLLSASRAVLVYDSSRLPGEIIDLMVGRTEVLKANPNLALALTGAWYESLARLRSNGEGALEAQRAMAKSLGTDLAGVRAQLSTTELLKPAEALGFLRSPALERNMDLVRAFCFAHGLLGKTPGVDAVGIALPGGRTLGDPKQIKLRFDDRSTQLFVTGQLSKTASLTQVRRDPEASR